MCETDSKTPGMKVDGQSTLQQLYKWNAMYHCRLFNPLPGHMLTEEDVTKVLVYHRYVSPGRAHLSGDNKLLFPPRSQPTHKRLQTQTVHNKSIGHFLAAIPPRLEVPDHEDDATDLTELRNQVIGQSDDHSMGHVTSRHAINGRLLRRPRFPPEYGLPYVTALKVDAESLESKRVWSYTTFHDDAPFTPDSYYVRNYPMALQQVPKRTTEELEADSTYHLMPCRPMMSMTFFDNLPSTMSSCSISTGSPSPTGPNLDDIMVETDNQTLADGNCVERAVSVAVVSESHRNDPEIDGSLPVPIERQTKSSTGICP